MPRESKTVQVYPSDSAVNASIKEHEDWGWEVVTNQRCQEFVRQDSDGTKHYETFVKITYSRDKDAPWYREVMEIYTKCDIIAEHLLVLKDDLENNRFKHHLEAGDPEHPGKRAPVFSVPLMLFLFLLAIFPGVLYLCLSKAPRGAQKKAIVQEYNAKYAAYKKRGTERVKAKIERDEDDFRALIRRRNELLGR